MRGKFGFRNALESGAIELEEVEKEVSAQIQWFVEMIGCPPTHVDGHQHVHVLPALVPLLARILARTHITHVRIPQQDLTKATWMEEAQREFLAGVAQQAAQAQKIYLEQGIRSTEYFMGLSTMGSAATADRVIAILQEIVDEAKKRKNGQTLTVEWMVHPGWPSNVGDKFNRSPDRLHEFHMLQSPWLSDFYLQAHIRLVSFRDLQTPQSLNE
jgi:predicted glycoside hydrolase/deacetylase ChbG (UPF0249 family)